MDEDVIMNYIGSKLTLIDFLVETIWETLSQNGDNRRPQELQFADLFAGTGVVSVAAKEMGCNVISNDLQYYSYVLCRHLVQGGAALTKQQGQLLCDQLFATPPEEGFIYRNYSAGGTAGSQHPRCYFSDFNAAKCDGMRTELERLREKEEVSMEEYYFLLASLITSVDRYANTASVYGAFLKTLKKTAQKDLVLTPMPIIHGSANYQVYNADANALLKHLSGDILYVDPPYNVRQYSSNYHLLETIARWDFPVIGGKTGVRKVRQKSEFCSYRYAERAMEELISQANYRYIFLSYNNEGLLPLEKIEEIMSRYGYYSAVTQRYRRFKADSDENRCHKGRATTEYLHILIKDSV